MIRAPTMRRASSAASFAHGLGQVVEGRAEATLLRAAAEPLSPIIRAAAVAALRGYCGDRARQARATALGDSDPNVVAAAKLPSSCGGK